MIVNQGPGDVLKKFNSLGSGLIISAESECWPDDTLKVLEIFDLKLPKQLVD